MKRRLLLLFYWFAYHGGLVAFFYFLRRRNQVVVTYHNVISDHLFVPNKLIFGVSCSEAAFRQQVATIRSRLRISTRHGEAGTCMLTFDDGYKNNAIVVCPIIEGAGGCGVFFVPACAWSTNGILWPDAVCLWLSAIPQGTYSLLGHNVVLDHSEESRKRAWGVLYASLLHDYARKDELLRQMEAILPMESVLRHSPPALVLERFSFISQNDAEQMKAKGHVIAHHSFKHDILSKLTPQELADDFAASAVCQRFYNSGYYSYPFGGEAEVSPAVIQAACDHGFKTRFVNIEQSPRFPDEVGRICLHNCTNPYVIHAKLSGLESWLKKIVRQPL